MPEHIHLLLTESEVGTPSTVMQVLKQRTARALLPKRKRSNPRQRNRFADKPQRRAFWHARFYDFNVWTTKKRVEKLRYMHRNPVKRGLVESPEEWCWSSYRFYLLEEDGGRFRFGIGWLSFAATCVRGTRPFAKNATERGTHRVGDGSDIKSLGHPPAARSPSYPAFADAAFADVSTTT
jgi:REP element-mobilizing transposase RayT